MSYCDAIKAYSVTTRALFERNAMGYLLDWREGLARKPLVIRGARQVGKTFLVRMFSDKFGRYAELNLARAEHAALFKRNLPAKELLQSILLECALPASDQPLLVFLDEIQDCPEAVEMLRFFHEDCPNTYFIAAGSLLEVALEVAQISFPVGRVEYLHLHPLAFDEFLLAIGEQQAHEAYTTIPTPAFAEAKLLRLFHRYVLVGGMPAAVARYAHTDGDMTRTRQVYAELLIAFRDDIPKYARNSTQRQVLMHCLDAAPQLVGTRITFHGFGGSNYRSREAGEALRTLERAMLLSLMFPTTQVELPLLLDRRKSPRLQFLDTGLVNYRLGLQQQLMGVEDLNDTYRGRIIEQVVGQELLARGTFEASAPVFWVRDKAQSQAEVDFILQLGSDCIPVEVKSGAAGKMRSLHQFMARSAAPFAVRLYAGPPVMHEVVHGDIAYSLLNLPYWTAGRLDEWGQYAAAERALMASPDVGRTCHDCAE